MTDLDEQAVRDALAGSAFADVWIVDETGSTNADLLERARTGAPEGTVLVAEHQTAGRGRLDRSWAAPAGSSLLVSVLTRPTARGLAPDQLFLVTTAIGVAACDAVRAALGEGTEAAAGVRLKWPNDVVVDGPDEGTRKLSGILAETVIEDGAVAALVVGIGVNVNWPAELPEDLVGVATAVNHLAGASADRATLLVDLLRRFDHWYADIATPAGRGRLLGRYREVSATLGRRVRVELAVETVVGDAVDISGEGHLLVVDECPDRPREIVAGDVVHLRTQA